MYKKPRNRIGRTGRSFVTGLPPTYTPARTLADAHAEADKAIHARRDRLARRSAELRDKITGEREEPPPLAPQPDRNGQYLLFDRNRLRTSKVS